MAERDATEFLAIVGRTLTGIAVSKDGESTLRLTFADGDPCFVSTAGDCCSQSWWADVLGAAAAYGCIVTAVRHLDMPAPGEDGRTRQEHDQAYGYQIDTSRGSVTLAFRNSSNGYYGGWANHINSCDIADWKEVVDNDWHA